MAVVGLLMVAVGNIGKYEINYLYMKLPKIQEDEYPLKNTYFQSIAAKPLKKCKTEKLIFDWQAAQVELISRIPDEEELLQLLIQLQNACRAFEVPHFYSYFFVSHLLFQMSAANKQTSSESVKGQQKTAANKKIKDQVQELKNKKSKWHRIMQLIQLRQNLVSKINKNVADNSLQTVYTYLDDIRFINFEIIKKVSQWSQSNLTDSEVHPFFLYEGNNYLIKMINDNTNVINVLNGKAVKFLSPPNPFYLSRDGNKSSMSQTQQSQIDSGMQILAKQKAQSFKFSPQFSNLPELLKRIQKHIKNLKFTHPKEMNKIKLTRLSQKDLKFRSLKDLKIYLLSLTTAKLTEFEA